MKVNANSEVITIPSEINEATSGLTNEFTNILLRVRNQANALTISTYIITMKQELDISDNYRMSTIKVLAKMSNSCVQNKEFLEFLREDLSTLLNSTKKLESLDPLHKWIGTYNTYIIIISRFFKWLHYPDLPQKERPKPEVVVNLRQINRREKSIYKPTDLWTQEDDLLFLYYCPSCRPLKATWNFLLNSFYRFVS